jgi:hypothetical protein
MKAIIAVLSLSFLTIVIASSFSSELTLPAEAL